MRAAVGAWAALAVLTGGCAFLTPPGPPPKSLDADVLVSTPTPPEREASGGRPPGARSAPGESSPSPAGIPKSPLSPRTSTGPSEPELPPAASPPPVVRVPPPPPKVSPPDVPVPAPVEPAPAPPPPVVAARVPHEDQIAQEVTSRLTKAQEIIDRIDASRLSQDQREIFSSVQDFVAKARDAFKTRDMPRAQVLAEKASRLADDLAATIKR